MKSAESLRIALNTQAHKSVLVRRVPRTTAYDAARSLLQYGRYLPPAPRLQLHTGDAID